LTRQMNRKFGQHLIGLRDVTEISARAANEAFF